MTANLIQQSHNDNNIHISQPTRPPAPAPPQQNLAMNFEHRKSREIIPLSMTFTLMPRPKLHISKLFFPSLLYISLNISIEEREIKIFIRWSEPKFGELYISAAVPTPTHYKLSYILKGKKDVGFEP